MLTLGARQLDAQEMMVVCNVGVLTGAPGTGKTATLLETLPHIKGSVALAAPTGRAARRMAEVTGHPASTIHRLLGMQPGGRPTFDEGNPLPFRTLLIDESSMLDIPLAAMLLRAVDTRASRIFFIGDVDQLPSVGPGQFFDDLIQSGTVPVIRLDTVHRSAQESWVCRNAPEILKGSIDLKDCADFRFIDVDEPAACIAQCQQTVADLVDAHGADNVQLITPMNVGDVGGNLLNPAIQEALNSYSSDSFSVPISRGFSHRIQAGDRVVAIANDYDRLVFNGETGIVQHVYGRGDGAVSVNFYDREIEYSKSDASENLRLAYALSCHKVQGGEFPHVVVVMHEAHGRMLSRRLFYTAVTRARKTVTIIGQRTATIKAVRTEADTLRSTTLGRRLSQLANPKTATPTYRMGG